MIEMRIALFGGTFDPIHNGHLNAANAALRFAACSQVWFIPCYWHVFKPNSKITDIEKRRKMVELAIASEPKFKQMQVEAKPQYTIDAIRKFKREFPQHQYFWLIGSNLLDEFPTWRESEEILKEVKLIVMPLPNFKKIENQMIKQSNPIVLSAAERTSISSTMVREKIEKDEGISDLVPRAVENYIMKNKLYR